MTITEGIKPYHGVNNVLTHYNIIWDPYLGIGRCEIKIISYLCIDFINVMDLSWDQYLVPKAQPRYSSVKKQYYPILGKHNDWVLMDYIDKVTYEEEY